MRVLVACEFSGIVRDAFAERNHYAVSCDLLPTERPGRHRQRDVQQVLEDGWDMMLAFPPCTYLARSGLHWNSRIPGRADKTERALDFVRMLLGAPIPKICLENPLGRISTAIRKPDQIIQPWEFGHYERKSTCLWLKGLPLLVPTNVIQLADWDNWDNVRPDGQHRRGCKATRAADDSRTRVGIALGMAAQWG